MNKILSQMSKRLEEEKQISHSSEGQTVSMVYVRVRAAKAKYSGFKQQAANSKKHRTIYLNAKVHLGLAQVNVQKRNDRVLDRLGHALRGARAVHRIALREEREEKIERKNIGKKERCQER